MAWVAAATIGGSVIGGLIQGDASKRAANTQADAANRATDLQWQQYEQARKDNQPYREAGISALDRLLGRSPDYTLNQEKIAQLENRLKGINEGQSYWSNLLKSGGAFGGNQSATWQANLDSHNADAADVQKQLDELRGGVSTQVMRSPSDIAKGIIGDDIGYQFRLDQGNKAINAAASARGRAVSGAAMKELNRYNQDYSSQEYGNAYNRLAQMAGIGQSTNNQNANLGLNYSNMAGNNMMGAGNATASGIVGQGNALNDAIGGGVNSWMQYNMMKKMFPKKEAGGYPNYSLGYGSAGGGSGESPSAYIS